MKVKIYKNLPTIYIFFYKNGEFKILDRCTLPLTGSKCVDLIITEKCVFEIVPNNGLLLTELADGVDIDEVRTSTECDFKVKF